MIGVLSINYKKANLEIREQFSFSQSEVSELYYFILDKYAFDGLFILSTCNRTELYFEKDNNNPLTNSYSELFTKLITDFKNYKGDIEPFVYIRYGLEAVNHFFSVVGGLKSLVFGEYQIVSQVKEAYALAKKRKVLGLILERMIHKAFETGKSIRTNTEISKGTVSVSSTAVEIALDKLGNNKTLKALTVGTGETGQLVVQYLKQKGYHNIFLSNRTYEHAVNISKTFDAEVIEFDKMHQAMVEMDMVTFSTSAKKPLIDISDMQKIMAARNNRPIFLIDVGVPRNVSDLVEPLEGVELLNLDKLKSIIEQNTDKKKNQLAGANIIVDANVEEFKNWLDARQLKKTFLLISNSFAEVNKMQAEKFKESDAYDEVTQYGEGLSKQYSKIIIRHLLKASKKGVKKDALEFLEEVFVFN